MTAESVSNRFDEIVERMRAGLTQAADGYEGVTMAGLAVVRRDGEPQVFLAQRAYDETDDEDVRETWEFVGGHLSAGEEPFAAAVREWGEEIGFDLPDGEVLDGWRAGDDGHYQGFVFEPGSFPALTDWEPTDEVQAVGWFTREQVENMDDLRPEVRDHTDWDMIFGGVSGNEEAEMSDETHEPGLDPDEFLDSDEIDLTAFSALPWHGVLAPEGVRSGDGRRFLADSLVARPLPLLLDWQKVSGPGHDQAYPVASIEKMARIDGMIHASGHFLTTDEADELVAVMVDMGGRYGVSIDADEAELSSDPEDERTVDFSRGRISGATAVKIPAFAEAYMAFGPHPVLDAEDTETGPDPLVEEDDPESGLQMSADLLEQFRRGKGWVTHPRETRRIHSYWIRGEGAAKIAWGTPGDFRRCRVLVGAKIAQNSPEKMRFINQICAEWHHDATGIWPGDRRNPGNQRATLSAAAFSVSEKPWDGSASRFTPEQWRRSTLIDTGEGDEDSKDRYKLPIREPDGALSRAGVHAAAARINQTEASEAQIASAKRALRAAYAELDEDPPDVLKAAATPVLTASSGASVPPFDYFANPMFDRVQPLTVLEADENGWRRVYGHAAEWGECHVGYLSQTGDCITPPFSESAYDYFLLGRMMTDAGPIKVGPVTADTQHADHMATWQDAMRWYDNTGNTWAYVNVGEDEHGVWMSGIVRPGVSDDLLFNVAAVGQVSGDWRTISGSLEMIGLLSVNGPGFPKTRPTMATKDGVQISLSGAGVVTANGDTVSLGGELDRLADEVADRLAARQRADQERARRLAALRERMAD